jgi:6-phosphogluconolactonase
MMQTAHRAHFSHEVGARSVVQNLAGPALPRSLRIGGAGDGVHLARSALADARQDHKGFTAIGAEPSTEHGVTAFRARQHASRHLQVARAIVAAGKGRSGAGAPAFSLALAGGTTPRALYRLLAAGHRDQIAWDQVHVFWSDERYVPADDPRSNYQMARGVWLDRVPIPAQNVHPMPTDFSDPDAAARAYETTLRAHFPGPWPRFDVILLGLGADGHTASLFPGSPALDERERWVVVVRAPIEPSLRLTLTLPVLNHAAAVWFLVSGADKTPALQQTLEGGSAVRSHPAVGVRPEGGAVIWWVDEAAARLLGQPVRGNHAERG